VKRLKIEYDGRTLFDADVAECTWVDSAAQVSVTGKAARTGNGKALLSALTARAEQ